MARIRSPNYPAISLAEAIKRVGQIHVKERQHPCSKEVAIKGIGYSGIHGVSLGALSALVKYGLLDQEGRGEDYRVSDRAVAILHPHTPTEKAVAINEAARSPVLFNELLDYFNGSLPSDDNLRAYLVRKGFSQTSLANVIQSFRETMELVSSNSEGYNSGISQNTEEQPMESHTSENPASSRSSSSARPVMRYQSTSETGKFQFAAPAVEMEVNSPQIIDCGGVLQISGFVDLKGLEKLIKKLTAYKAVLEASFDDSEEDPKNE